MWNRPSRTVRLRLVGDLEVLDPGGALLVAGRVVALDVEGDGPHQYFRSCGSKVPRVTGTYSSRGPSGV